MDDNFEGDGFPGCSALLPASEPIIAGRAAIDELKKAFMLQARAMNSS